MRTISNANRLFRGNLYRSFDISSSGMTAQRRVMDAVASNIANASTTNVDGQGNPYLRRRVHMQTDPRQSFAVSLRQESMKLLMSEEGHIQPDSIKRQMENTPLVEGNELEMPNMRKNVIYDPAHPDADENGFVVMPDVNIIDEMADLMVASRAFEANVTVLNAAKGMISKSLEI